MVEKWHGRVEMPSFLPAMHQICLNFQLEVLFTIFDHSGIAQIEYWGLQFTLSLCLSFYSVCPTNQDY